MLNTVVQGGGYVGSLSNLAALCENHHLTQLMVLSVRGFRRACLVILATQLTHR